MSTMVGQPAPSFTLPSTKDATSPKTLGKEISLSDYKGKWLVFFFYPLDFTFVCPTEILALSDRLEEFQDLDAEVLGASTDSVHSHFAWLNTPREKNGIAGTKYPLVLYVHGGPRSASKDSLIFCATGMTTACAFSIPQIPTAAIPTWPKRSSTPPCTTAWT